MENQIRYNERTPVPAQPPNIPGDERLYDTDLTLATDTEEYANGSEKIVEDSAGEPVVKVKTNQSVNNINSVPNGGLKAWLQVLGAFFLMFNTWYVTDEYTGLTSTSNTALGERSTPSATIRHITSLASFSYRIRRIFPGSVPYR